MAGHSRHQGQFLHILIKNTGFLIFLCYMWAILNESIIGVGQKPRFFVS